MCYIPLALSLSAIPFVVASMSRARKGRGIGASYIIGAALAISGLCLSLF